MGIKVGAFPAGRSECQPFMNTSSTWMFQPVSCQQAIPCLVKTFGCSELMRQPAASLPWLKNMLFPCPNAPVLALRILLPSPLPSDHSHTHTTRVHPTQSTAVPPSPSEKSPQTSPTSISSLPALHTCSHCPYNRQAFFPHPQPLPACSTSALSHLPFNS